MGLEDACVAHMNLIQVFIGILFTLCASVTRAFNLLAVAQSIC